LGDNGGAPNDAATRSLAASLYSVVRCHGSRPSERIRFHRLGRHFLAMGGAGGAGDTFVHQCAAEIARTRRQAGGRALRPIFAHEVWMFAMNGWSARRATACINTASRNVGPNRLFPCSCIGASMGTKGNRNEFSEATSFLLQPANVQEVARPVLAARRRGRNMMVAVVRSPRRCGVSMTSIHWDGGHLVGTNERANLVIEKFRRGSRQRAEPGCFQAIEEAGDACSERRRTLEDFERRERVTMQVGYYLFDGAADRKASRPTADVTAVVCPPSALTPEACAPYRAASAVAAGLIVTTRTCAS
jgi:hypothetical protein